MMKRCEKCNAKWDVDHFYCGECGQALRDDEESVSKPEERPEWFDQVKKDYYDLQNRICALERMFKEIRQQRP